MIPKHIGRDCELSSTGIDERGGAIDPGRVTRMILREVPAAVASRGAAVWTESSRFSTYSMDCLRNWSSNGQCHYADMAHVECCTPTCLDPIEFAAHCLCMLRVAEEARRRAQQASGEPVTLSLSASNADLLDPGISFGTHLSVSIERSLWEDLFHTCRRPCRLAMVASGLAAAIPFFGAGYLLPMKDGVVYSLSARAHHLSRVWSVSTTEAFRRGMLNSRREPHGEGLDRLHIIGFDFCLLSGPLLGSLVQCLLAAAEENFCGLQLLDPIRALRTWSYGLDLETGQLPERAALVDGRQLTLPEYMQELVEVLLRMVECGLIGPEIAPRSTEMLPRILQLAEHAKSGAVRQCALHLTWASKLLYLLNVCQEEDVELGDATARLLDHDFTNTDPDRGPIWRLWDDGLVDPLVPAAEVERVWREPPPGSRDAVRGRMIERFGESISHVDWSRVELRQSDDRWAPRIRIDFPHLDRASCGGLAATVESARNVDELVEGLSDDGGDSRDPLDDMTSDLHLPGPGPDTVLEA